VPAARPPFRDRQAAGKSLGAALTEYRDSDALVVGVARRGIEVADELARTLNLDMDVAVARKLLAPDHPRLAIGAADAGGIVVWDETTIALLGLTACARSAELARVRRELETLQRNYRTLLPRARTTARDILVVDDYLGTGATMSVAVRALAEAGPKRLVVAVPGGTKQGLEELAALEFVDEVVALAAPAALRDAADLYTSHDPVSDHWVCHLLRGARERRRRARPASAGERLW
jgi:predicted phosphoribosyltransferase